MTALGFSTCPNDTFIFDALVNRRLNHTLEINVFLGDVDELNKKALNNELDITKLSFGIVPDVSENYQILDSGSALGFGCGPLLISLEQNLDLSTLNSDFCVAIPGEKTTANLLLSMAYPQITNKKVMLFSEIEAAVLSGDVQAGLIIHENRFTYKEKGLHKLIDLGEFWEKKTGLPIPLGCIAVKRSLSTEVKKEIQAQIRESVMHAFSNPNDSKSYIALHAQEMNPEVMQQHIDLYVNDYSISLGEEGKKAIDRLFLEGRKAGILKEPFMPLFVED
ncbi:MAG: 1,4-dihydroxy-6-naphthoate synthase [Bacteroidia bacterium]